MLIFQDNLNKNMSNSFSYRPVDKKIRTSKKIGEKANKHKRMESSKATIDGQMESLKSRMKT